MTTPRRQRRAQAREKPQTTAAQGGFIQVPVHWEGTDEVPIMMANQIFVRYTEGQVVIAFGQGIGPYELQISKDTEERLKHEGIPVRTVAQIAVSPGRLATMLGRVNELLAHIPEIVEQEAKPPTVRQP